MNFNNIKITIFKEIRGIIRDKKSFQKLITYPLLIPFIIIFFGLINDAIGNTNVIIGVNYEVSNEEKTIIDSMDTFSLKEYKDEDELEEAYRKKEINGYIIKSNNKYVVYSDESQTSGQIALSNASLYLETYNKLLGNKYLLEKGIDFSLVYNNIVIENKSLIDNDVDSFSKIIFSMIISYFIMIIVMVSIVVVVDSTSGEKERGTLETILTFPVNSSELIVGKYLASSILSFIVGLISYLLSFPTFAFAKNTFVSYENVVISTNIGYIFIVIFVLFLAALLSSGICMALCGKAKSYKEAQSSLQFLTLLPMIPLLLSMFEFNSFYLNFIPISNCSILLNDIVFNKVDFLSLLIVILSTIVYIGFILIYVSKQYKKEETLFS